jgi:hypothetical protein
MCVCVCVFDGSRVAVATWEADLSSRGTAGYSGVPVLVKFGRL